jgi:hypothetical protein
VICAFDFARYMLTDLHEKLTVLGGETFAHSATLDEFEAFLVRPVRTGAGVRFAVFQPTLEAGHWLRHSDPDAPADAARDLRPQEDALVSVGFWLDVGVIASIYGIFVLGLQINVGFTGLLNLGQAGFMSHPKLPEAFRRHGVRFRERARWPGPAAMGASRPLKAGFGRPLLALNALGGVFAGRQPSDAKRTPLGQPPKTGFDQIRTLLR